MIMVKIGDEERRFDGRPQWIHEQFERRKGVSGAVCVRVSIDCGDIRMLFTTPFCAGGSGGGSRSPTPKETAIFDLWEKHKLNNSNFNSGNLTAFLKQVDHLC